jgi:hypothetical protein
VDRHDRPCPRRDRGGGRVGVEVAVVAHVGEHGRGPGLADGLHGRHERVRGSDHLVARPDSGGLEPQPQGVEPAGHADAVRDAAVAGEGGLEARDGRPVDEGAGVDQLLQAGDERLLERPVARPEVDERDGGHWFGAKNSTVRASPSVKDTVGS